MSMRLRAGIGLMPFLLLAAACTGGSPVRSSVSVLPHHAGLAYHDASGWTIRVPAGWHVLPFRSSSGRASAAGVQLSNVKLPAPSVVPSFPIQANNKVLSGNAIALIIATDNDPGLCQSASSASCHGSYATLPLPRPYTTPWSVASSPLPSAPLFGDLWFKGGHHAYIATIKIGAKVFNDSHLAVLAKILASLRFART